MGGRSSASCRNRAASTSASGEEGTEVFVTRCERGAGAQLPSVEPSSRPRTRPPVDLSRPYARAQVPFSYRSSSPLCLKRAAFSPSKSQRSLMLPAPSWVATAVRHPGLLAVAWLSLGTWSKLTAVAESGAPGRGGGEAQGVPGQGCIWGGGSQPPNPRPLLTSALLPGSSRGVRGEGHRTMSGRFPSEPFLCR